MSRRLRWALVALPVLLVPATVTVAQAEVAPRNSAGWAPLSVQGVPQDVDAGLGYLPDGTLLVAWTDDGPEPGLWTNTVAPAQGVGDPVRRLTPEGLGAAPDVLSSATGADIMYVSDTARRLTYDAATGETAPTDEVFFVGGASTSAQFDTARRPSGAIVVNQRRTWHVGPAGEEVDDERLSDELVPHQVDESAVATAGNTTHLTYYTYTGDLQQRGSYVVPIEPSVGTPVKLPGSWYLDQQPALEGSTSGTLWAAYCTGVDPCDQLVLRNVTAGTSMSVPTGDFPAQIALTAAPDGRMWVVWRSGNAAVSAVRTNKAGTAFGAVQRSAPFNTPNEVDSVVAAGARGPVDVVMNGRGQIWHKRFLAPMTATASPAKWRVNRKQTVAFKVRDAGDALSGAKVALVGKTCTTGTTGGCSITVPARSAPATLTAVVTKAGYRETAVTLRVVR